MRRHPSAPPNLRRQRGVYAIVFGLMVIVIIGFIGLTLDLGQMYNRRTEMQNLADVAALGAARQLNGTAQGVANAIATAQSIAVANKYKYKLDVSWAGAALTFSTAPDGTWMDASSAAAAPAGLLFAKVDTSALGAPVGAVATVFASIMPGGQGTALVRASAVAGRASITALPLAICALDPIMFPPPRTNGGTAANAELVEYGFRRGVGYNLLSLNPSLTSLVPQNFLINPIDIAPADTNNPLHMTNAVVAPFICTGTMPRLAIQPGDQVYVAPFPPGLTNELNSRFQIYAGSACNPITAPPDRNQYQFVAGPGSWMSNASPFPVAKPSNPLYAPLKTVADYLDPTNNTPNEATIAGTSYGTLWAFARPVRASTNVPFVISDWSTLYKTKPAGSPPTASTYPPLPLATSKLPYDLNQTPRLTAPSTQYRGLRNRRVLFVPLLSCPVAGSTATVLGIGRFLMTTVANAGAINAEFGGLSSSDLLTADVALYP